MQSFDNGAPSGPAHRQPRLQVPEGHASPRSGRGGGGVHPWEPGESRGINVSYRGEDADSMEERTADGKTGSGSGSDQLIFFVNGKKVQKITGVLSKFARF